MVLQLLLGEMLGISISSHSSFSYQNQPEHANFKQLLEMPLEDAQSIIDGIFFIYFFIQ